MNKSTFVRPKGKAPNTNTSQPVTHSRKLSHMGNQLPLYIGVRYVRFNVMLLQAHTKIELKGEQDAQQLTQHNEKTKPITLTIEGTQLHILYRHHVKHSFDVLECAGGQVAAEKGKKFNLMMELPQDYTLTVKNVSKHIQLKAELSPPTEDIQVIRPIELLEEAVRVRAMKLNKSKRKHETSMCKFNWNMKSTVGKSANKSSKQSRRMHSLLTDDELSSSIVYTQRSTTSEAIEEIENGVPELPLDKPSTTKKNQVKGIKGTVKNKKDKSFMVQSIKPLKPHNSNEAIGKNFRKTLCNSKPNHLNRTVQPLTHR